MKAPIGGGTTPPLPAYVHPTISVPQIIANTPPPSTPALNIPQIIANTPIPSNFSIPAAIAAAPIPQTPFNAYQAVSKAISDYGGSGTITSIPDIIANTQPTSVNISRTIQDILANRTGGAVPLAVGSTAGPLDQSSASAAQTPPPVDTTNAGAGGAPLPNEGVYAQDQAAANKAYVDAKNLINTKRAEALHKYGFTGDINQDTGAMSNVGVDPNNPLGGYQQIRRNHAMSNDNLYYNENARGGLTGGLMNRDAENLQNTQGLEDQNFGNAYTGEMQNLDQGLLTAKTDLSNALLGITHNQANDAINAANWTAINSAPASYTANAPTSPVSTAAGTTPKADTSAGKVSSAMSAAARRTLAKRIAAKPVAAKRRPAPKRKR